MNLINLTLFLFKQIIQAKKKQFPVTNRYKVQRGNLY